MFSNEKLVAREIVDNYFSDFGMSLLKKRRFEYGCVNKDLAKEPVVDDTTFTSKYWEEAVK